MGKSIAGGSDQSQKTVNRFEFPNQLFSGLEKTIGRPFSIQELFSMRPNGRAGRGVFGSPDPNPVGGLGFGQGGQGGQPLPQPGLPGGQPPASGGLGFSGPNAAQPAEQKFTANDLIGVVERIAPDKAADVGRLMTKGGLDPTGFTISDLEAAWSKFGDSSGNSKAVAAALLGTLADAQNTAGQYQVNRFAGGSYK